MRSKPRIAIHNPSFLLQDQTRNFEGYNYIFTLKYASALYVTDPRKIWGYKRTLKKLGREDLDIVLTTMGLNRGSDVVIGFNGRVEKLLHCCPKRYRGLKIYHQKDYVFCATAANRVLEDRGVDYLLGYCEHDKYCPFYQKYYPRYKNKVIGVPFGYGERCKVHKQFRERQNKAIALGSVNPVNDVGESLREYEEFYRDEEFTHKLRRAVVLNRGKWKEWIDDRLPTYPVTKNPSYDLVMELNDYTMFINDAGLMNFPPARTYEGIACGCVMVAENRDVYKELGFVDGQNCILFPVGDYEEMVKRIKYYMEHGDELERLHQSSIEMSKRYTHAAIADRLYQDILEKYEERLT